MKKVLSLLILAPLMTNHTTRAATPLSDEEALQEQTRFLQQGEQTPLKEQLKEAARRAKYGAVAGGALGGLAGGKTYTPEEVQGEIERQIEKIEALRKTVGSYATGAAVGAAAGAATVAVQAAFKAGLRMWQVHKINQILREKTMLADFRTFPVGQAMFFVAAYKRNTTLMRQLINRSATVPGDPINTLLAQKGVWNALAELFYNKKPTKAMVERLKKLVF